MNEATLRQWGETLDKQGLEWELYGMDGQSTSIEVRNQEVDTFKSSRNVGAALRIREAGRIGFSFTTDPSEEAFLRTVERARTSARALEPNEHAQFSHEQLPVAALALIDASEAKPTQ